MLALLEKAEVKLQKAKLKMRTSLAVPLVELAFRKRGGSEIEKLCCKAVCQRSPQTKVLQKREQETLIHSEIPSQNLCGFSSCR
jgi:hypothetical protein